MTTATLQPRRPAPPCPFQWNATIERNAAGGARRVTLSLPVQNFGNSAGPAESAAAWWTGMADRGSVLTL